MAGWRAGLGLRRGDIFFVVPDLLLTGAVIVFGLTRAFRLSIAAALAAVAGGLLMALWGASDASAARAFLLSVPLIGEDLLFRVHGEMDGLWPVELTLGAIPGRRSKSTQ